MPAKPITGAELRAIGLKSPPRTYVRAAQNSTTMPNPAPVNPGHALPINRPRVAHLYTCHDCGQSWTIVGVGGTFNRRPVRFCPACGTEAIQHTNSPFGGLECGAIKALRVERMLAQMLYQQWAANQHHEQDKHARFVDYLEEQLA